MSDTSGVNLIVRAIIEQAGHILLLTPTEMNKEFSTGLYFLPGGHVEYNEPSVDALKRELKEEINLASDAINSIKFKGALECSWDRKGRIYHELNLIYKVEAQGFSLEHPPTSAEPHYRFLWCPVSKIKDYPILPQIMPLLIQEAVKVDGKTDFYSQML